LDKYINKPLSINIRSGSRPAGKYFLRHRRDGLICTGFMEWGFIHIASSGPSWQAPVQAVPA
jgi:hypothetical protein